MAEVSLPSTPSAATVSPANAASSLAPAALMPPLGTMQDALAAATPALKQCSKHARGLLFVNFTTIANGERFAVSVPGGATDAVDRCVQAATANMRFQAHTAETFTVEYTP